MMLVIGLIYGKYSSLVNNITQNIDQSRNSGNESSVMGPTVPGRLPQISEAEQPGPLLKLDAVCPPLCNNSNMTNRDFFRILAEKELWEPRPWKNPFSQETYMKQQSNKD